MLPPNANYILPPFQQGAAPSMAPRYPVGTQYGIGNGVGMMGPNRSLTMPPYQTMPYPQMPYPQMPYQPMPYPMQPPMMMGGGMPPMMMGGQPQQQNSGLGSILAMAAPLFNNVLGDTGFSIGSGPRPRRDADLDDEDCISCRPKRRTVIDRLPEDEDGLHLPGRNMRAGDRDEDTEAAASQVPRRRYTPAPQTVRTVPQSRQTSLVQASSYRTASVDQPSAKPNMGDRVANVDDGDDDRQLNVPAPAERPVMAAAVQKPAQKPKLGDNADEKPRPAPRREGIRSERDTTPGRRQQVQARVPYNNRIAQGVPQLWSALMQKLAVCAPGCVPRGYNSYAPGVGHIEGSCHYQYRAIDIEALKCPSGMIQGENRGFSKIVACLDRIQNQGTKTRILYSTSRAGDRKTRRKHHGHMHFSLTCNGGRTI